VIASSIPGLETSNFTSLTNLGIRTELDGTISIDEKDFTNAFENNFEDVQKLLAPFNDSSSDDVTINSFGDNTVAGSYDVEITSNPTQGVYNGAAFTGDLDTTGEVYTFVVDVNGTTSETITIPTEERLLNQFIAMERILSSLDTSGSFLDNLIDTLPFTSGQGR